MCFALFPYRRFPMSSYMDGCLEILRVMGKSSVPGTLLKPTPVVLRCDDESRRSTQGERPSPPGGGPDETVGLKDRAKVEMAVRT